MTLTEKSLYHQIHSLKLFTDRSTGLIALYPFGRHHLLLALLIALVTSIVVSFLLILFADLEKDKQSQFGMVSAIGTIYRCRLCLVRYAGKQDTKRFIVQTRVN